MMFHFTICPITGWNSLSLYISETHLYRFQLKGARCLIVKSDSPLTSPPGADCDVDSAVRFIAAIFVSLNATPNKLIYHHFTTATDTSNIQVVFQVVMDTIIKENLEAVSLL